MRRPAMLGSAFVVCSLLVAQAQSQTPQPPAPPPFRAGTDLVLLDVSVLDKQHQPVRGLTATDFVVTIDGKPVPIAAFKAIDLPPAPPRPPVGWLSEVAPDVASNDGPTG